MAEYKTAQKKMLIDFLKAHREQSFTIDEIAKLLPSEKNSAPALSTLYRLMPKLVDDGFVKKFTGDKTRRFLYQIVDEETCGKHLHMKCTGCGRLFHMNNEISENLLNEILKESHFTVDKEKNILLGKCSDCANSSEVAKETEGSGK